MEKTPRFYGLTDLKEAQQCTVDLKQCSSYPTCASGLPVGVVNSCYCLYTCPSDKTLRVADCLKNTNALKCPSGETPMRYDFPL